MLGRFLMCTQSLKHPSPLFPAPDVHSSCESPNLHPHLGAAGRYSGTFLASLWDRPSRTGAFLCCGSCSSLIFYVDRALILTLYSLFLHHSSVHTGIMARISGTKHEGCYSVALSGGYEDDKDEGYRL